MHAVERLAARDADLFLDPVIAADRLGWVGSPQAAVDEAPALIEAASQAAVSGATDVVVLGMGGSSLASLVLSKVFGPAEGRPALHVLDTTSPLQVSALMSSLDPESTLVIVSSKSGTTVEPLALAAAFGDWMEPKLGDRVGAHFYAITDPGSPLDEHARANGYARVFAAPPDVGGRYSALTPFATVPAAFAGIDVARLATSALRTEEECSVDDPDNPGAALAAWLADAYAEERDKLTIVVSEPFAAFGLWVEQLVAESTGKHGVGLLPVLEDAPGDPSAHGEDRLTYVLRTPDDLVLAGLGARLPDEEHVFESVVHDAYGLGGEFVRWEWAVALFCVLSGIEPFDQPNVAEAKAATEAILERGIPSPSPERVEVRTPGSEAGDVGDLAPALREVLDKARPGSYLAVLAYLPDAPALLSPLRDACALMAGSRRMAVTFELGPRYLHSTGQYHKGGPANGLFVVLTAGSAEDVRVPGKPYTLGVLNRAQAAGDIATLRAHGRPVIEVALPDPGRASIEAVAVSLREAAAS
jgi:glucose-6-phosphate isomerase